MPGGGHLSAAKCRGVQLLLCKLFLSRRANHTHPSASLPQLDGQSTWKAMAGGCFPWGMSSILDIRKEGAWPWCFPHRCYSTPCFWFGSLASYHSAGKFTAHCLCPCQFISMYAPVSPKAILALSFLPELSPEPPLNWRWQSNHIVNDFHEGRCHCNKTQGTEQGWRLEKWVCARACVCVCVCAVSGRVNPRPCGDGYPTLRSMQPLCQLEKELSGEDGACYPQPVCWGGHRPAGKGDCYPSWSGWSPWLRCPKGLVAGQSAWRSSLMVQVVGLGLRCVTVSLPFGNLPSLQHWTWPLKPHRNIKSEAKKPGARFTHECDTQPWSGGRG